MGPLSLIPFLLKSKRKFGRVARAHASAPKAENFLVIVAPYPSILIKVCSPSFPANLQKTV